MDAYDRQDRGEALAYDRYLRGMDASMRQKVALTAAHLLSEGDVADMGMGSGSGSFALASLYPDLRVVGVDVNPEMVERALERYQLPNLTFVTGDVAKRCFEPGTQEAILNSSVLHHVTTFTGYDRSAAERALAVHVEMLSDHGVIVLRDFVDPGPGTVWLDLSTADGEQEASNPEAASSAALFERFAREFRILREHPEERGFPFQVIAGMPGCPLASGFRRYEVAHTQAVEFVLRKDYRADWATEIQEEYTYGTQRELESVFGKLGLRVLASAPIRNPWIVANRFRGRFRLWSPQGEALDYPATNYVIVGQKVPSGEGVQIVEGAAIDPLGYLEKTHYRHLETGRIFDLVRRPGETVDVLPWYERDGSLYVLARRSYPRPIVCCSSRGTVSVDGTEPSCYLTEPLNVQKGDKPLGQTVDELLAEFEGIGPEGIVRMEDGSTCYPSPGGLQEEVHSVLVEVKPVPVQQQLINRSGFSTSGRLRALEARQLLRAAQVGALPEARLELNVYDLLLRRGSDPGDWIGESVALTDDRSEVPVRELQALLRRPSRRCFRRVHDDDADFLVLHSARFDEHDAQGRVVAQRELEFVTPGTLSFNTVVVALLRRVGGQILLGLDDDDLPAMQCFRGNSQVLVAPAWRLPRNVHGVDASRGWVCARLQREYGVSCGGVWELGGRYHPSPGVTPEVVYPLAVEVLGECEDMTCTGSRRSHWVRLRDAVEQRGALVDGHLRIVTLRAAHALGVLG